MKTRVSTAGSAETFQVFSALGWIGIQLLALAVSAWGAPFWAHQPLPRTSLAAETMVAAQIVGISLLFPSLHADVRLSVICVAVTWPFLQLAGLLASTPERNLVTASCLLTVWMAGLAGLARQLTSTRARLITVALATGFSLGGAVLFYLHIESVQERPPSTAFGPLMGAIAQLGTESSAQLTPWLEAAVPGFAVAAMKFSKHRRLSSSTSHH